MVSAADIETADRTVRSGGRQRAWMSSVGGTIFGVGLGVFADAITSPQPGHLAMVFVVVAVVIGPALVFFSWDRHQ